ncbi:MAG: hypothetical protein EOM62_08445 [Bacteroidia bacterium]|nr:hypothetical protein [Bacteroidia bacterium]
MWKPYVRFSSFASGMKGGEKASAHIRYLTREKECLLWGMDSVSSLIRDRKDAQHRWKHIARMETGRAPLDTPAGRSRYDACVQVRLFLPLPNHVFDGMTGGEARDAINELVKEMDLDSTDVFWALHRGIPGDKKEREQNVHLHIAYRPRNEQGKKHRISIRREVVSLRESLGKWLQKRGYKIDWKSISKPGIRRHISPAKIAMAERGDELHSPEETVQAKLTLAKRLVAEFSRQEAKDIICSCLSSEAPDFSQLENALQKRGWALSRMVRGKRKTWILTDEAGKEYALRRIIEEKEKGVDSLLRRLKENDLFRKDTPEKEAIILKEEKTIPSKVPHNEMDVPLPSTPPMENDEMEPSFNYSPPDRPM